MCYRASCCFAFFECVRAIEKEMMERKEKRENGEKRKTEKKKKARSSLPRGWTCQARKTKERKKKSSCTFFPHASRCPPFSLTKVSLFRLLSGKKSRNHWWKRALAAVFRFFLLFFWLLTKLFFFPNTSRPMTLNKSGGVRTLGFLSSFPICI